MLLRHSLELMKEADALDAAAIRAMEAGARTPRHLGRWCEAYGRRKLATLSLPN